MLQYIRRLEARFRRSVCSTNDDLSPLCRLVAFRHTGSVEDPVSKLLERSES